MLMPLKKLSHKRLRTETSQDCKSARIRYITDDCMKFVAREMRRGNHYDGIILDPPKCGRGPKGEIWRLEEQLPELLSLCASLLSEDAIFMILTIYAIRTSTLATHSAVAEALSGRDGEITSGEVGIIETQNNPRAIGQALFVRYANYF